MCSSVPFGKPFIERELWSVNRQPLTVPPLRGFTLWGALFTTNISPHTGLGFAYLKIISSSSNYLIITFTRHLTSDLQKIRLIMFWDFFAMDEASIPRVTIQLMTSSE